MAYRSSFDDEFEGMDELLPSNLELARQTGAAKRSLSPKWKKNKSISNKKLASDPKWVEATNKAAKKRSNDPKWIAACKKAREELFADEERYQSYTKKLSESWTDERKEKWEEKRKELHANGAFAKDDDHRANLAASKGKEFNTPFGVYPSFYHFKKDHPSINVRDRLRLNPHQYYYVDIGPGKETYETVFYTPYGRHKYLKSMFERAKAAEDKNANVKDAKTWFKKMKKKSPTEYYCRTEVKIEWEYIE